jgi:mono/diheme cytochrome c family protein
MKRILFGLPCITLALLAETSAPAPQQVEFFENRIRPLLSQQCYACHTNSAMGGLRLDTREGMLKGGKSGAAIVPGDSDASKLMVAVRRTTELKMPLNGRLTDAQVKDLDTWIKNGAVWPETKVVETRSYTIRPDQKQFWSFQPLQKVAAPRPKDSGWALNDIDRFVLARLDKEGLKPAPAASRRTLIRRLS